MLNEPDRVAMFSGAARGIGRVTLERLTEAVRREGWDDGAVIGENLMNCRMEAML